MTLQDLVQALDMKVMIGDEFLDREVSGGYTSDLLSDVMAKAKEGNVWITIQTHQNVVAVASLLGLSAVIMSNGMQPDNSTLEKAKKGEVPILTSEWPSFELGAKVFNLLGQA
jgi:predicted transcriptional regulator